MYVEQHLRFDPGEVEIIESALQGYQEKITTLSSYIHSRGRWSVEQELKYVQQLLSAIENWKKRYETES